MENFAAMTAIAVSSVSRFEALLDLQQQLLTGLVEGREPRILMQQLCHAAEQMVPGRIASVMMIGEDDRLHVFAAPGAPEELIAALDRLTPGPGAGSCGNVIYRQAPVYVEDVVHDARWEDLRQVAAQWSIASCWSYPVRQDSRVIGTFALTSTTEGLPETEQEDLLEMLGSLAGVLTTYTHLQNRLTAQDERLQLLAAIAEQVPTGVLYTNATCAIRWANPAFLAMTGFDLEDIHGQNPRLLQGPETDPATIAQMRDAIKAEQPFAVEILNYRKDGTPFWLDIRCDVLRSPDGKMQGFVAIETDLSARKNRDEQFRQYACIFAGLQEAVVITDAQARFLEVNPAFERITGYCRSEVLGQSPQLLLHSGKHDADFYAQFWKSLHTTGTWQGEIWNRRKSGEIYPEWLSVAAIPDQDSHELRYVGIFRDITAEKEQDQKLAHLAFHDVLTGLPNRPALDAFLTPAMAQADAHEQLLMVSVLDIDDLHHINERHGSPVGDAVLRQFAEHLQAALAATDFVARLGGDGFSLVFQNVRSWPEMEERLNQLQHAFEQPVTLPDGNHIVVRARMGLTIYPLDEAGDEELLHHASLAMYQAKQKKSRSDDWYCLYEKVWDERFQTLAAQSREIAAFIDAEHVVAYYQPIVSLEDGSVHEVEALARIRIDGQLLAPGSFLQVLTPVEKSRLSILVFEQAVTQCARWNAEGLTVRIGVNFMPQDLLQPYFLESILSMLKRHDLPPDQMILEILEEGDFLSQQDAQIQMGKIRATGLHLALDDLGTAYASLLRLKDLPIDIIKLDQCFVRHLTQHPQDLHFAEVIQRLAEGLNVEMIAEGAEAPEVVTALRLLNIRCIQGYVFSPPVPGDEIIRLIRSSFPVPDTGLLPGNWFAAYAAHLRWMADNLAILRRQNYSRFTEDLRDTRLCPLHGVFAQDAILFTLHEEEHRLMGAIAAMHLAPSSRSFRRLTDVKNAVEHRLETLIRATQA